VLYGVFVHGVYRYSRVSLFMLRAVTCHKKTATNFLLAYIFFIVIVLELLLTVDSLTLE